MKRLDQSLLLHSPAVVHLHPTRIPDNSGAAARRIRSGLAFTVSSGKGRSRIMAKLGVVSEAFARGRSQLTALCELAVNVARKGE
jgi:hypothetical protein